MKNDGQKYVIYNMLKNYMVNTVETCVDRELNVMYK